MTDKTITTRKGYVFDTSKILTSKDVLLDNTPSLGTVGYFTNNIDSLSYCIDKQIKFELTACDYGTLQPFVHGVDMFAFFLPKDAVIPPKGKTYRPFKTVSEFLKTLGIDEKGFITFRDKRQPDAIYHVPYGGYARIDSEICFFLGIILRSTSLLYNYYEWRDKNEVWHPFGKAES